MNDKSNPWAGARTVELPSGRTASIRKGKGRDLIQASRMAGGASDGIKISMAIIAVLTLIDGEPLVIEQVEDMDLNDVMKLLAEAVGNGGSSLSSILSSSGSTDGSPIVN